MEELRDQGNYQGAVDAAVEGYGISVPKEAYPTVVGKFDVTIDPISNKITGSTDASTTYYYLSGQVDIEIYMTTFYRVVGKTATSSIDHPFDTPHSPGYAAATVGHEATHARGYLAGNGPVSDIDEAIFEVQATDWQLSHAAEFGLTLSEISSIYHYRQINYNKLPKNLQGQVDRGDYTFPTTP